MRNHRRLRGRIERKPRVRIADATDRGIDDDPPLAAREHHRELVAQAQEDGTDVGIEHVVIGAARLLLDRRAALLEAGIVEGDVEPAEAFDRGADQAHDVAVLRDVGRHRKRLRPECPARSGGGPDLGLTTARDQHRRGALGGHLQRRGATDAAAASGHQTDFSRHAVRLGGTGFDDRQRLSQGASPAIAAASGIAWENSCMIQLLIRPCPGVKMISPERHLIDEIRAASRQMVRELGFMDATVAATDYRTVGGPHHPGNRHPRSDERGTARRVPASAEVECEPHGGQAGRVRRTEGTPEASDAR